MGKWRRLRRKLNDQAVHIFLEQNKEADAWERGRSEAELTNGRIDSKVVGSRGHWTFWVLGWELSRRRMRRSFADQYFHTDFGEVYNFQTVLAGARQGFPVNRKFE